MTDAAAPETALPSGPPPVALAIAYDLVTRYRMRLADQRDSRLLGLGGDHELCAATWTGERAALVAFYEPPSDPYESGRDLAARCEAARSWGQQRLQLQGAARCDILLVALRPVAGSLSAAPTAGDAVNVGAVWVDAERGEVGVLLPPPPGLPSPGELRARARAVAGGAPTPTLAAVDLAERQTVAGGYAQPAQRALITQPVVTYGLIAAFAFVYLIQQADPNTSLVGALYNPTDSSSWWHFVTYAFVHGPLYHIFFNALAMLYIGRLVEQLYGRLVLLGTFLITAVVGGLLWEGAGMVGLVQAGLAANATVGASGGIMGLVGLLLMLGRLQGRNVPVGIAHGIRRYALTVTLLTVGFGFLFAGVNNYVHAGGLLAGAGLGAVLPPLRRIGGRDLSQVEQAIIVVVIAAAAVALAVGAYNLINTPPPLGQ